MINGRLSQPCTPVLTIVQHGCNFIITAAFIKIISSRGRWSRRIERLISKTIPTLAYFGDLFLKKIFIYFWLPWGFCCCLRAFSSCGGRLPFTAVSGFAAVASFVGHRLYLGRAGFSSWALVAPELRLSCGTSGLAASRQVGPSQTGDRAGFPHIARRTVNHWTTGKTADLICFYMLFTGCLSCHNSFHTWFIDSPYVYINI